MATTEQYSLRWNNFHSNLKSGFHELLEAAEMVDVTLAVDGQFLQAHKIVLSICSPYFRQMFKENPCKHPIVILRDVGHENMKDILQFMYMGEVSVLRENLSTFLRTAELLQVKGLSGDDPSEESSSAKDEKIGCDNGDENVFSQMIETTADIDVPHYTTSNQANALPVKRQFKTNTNGNVKRPKSDIINQKPVKTETDVVKPKVDLLTCDYTERDNINVESSSNEEEGKESKPLNWDFGATSLESSMLEQDAAAYSAEKGHVFCPYCCRKFVNRYNLKVHIRDKHETNTTYLDCQICGKTMRNQSCLRVHLYHHRKQQTETDTA